MSSVRLPRKFLSKPSVARAQVSPSSQKIAIRNQLFPRKTSICFTSIFILFIPRIFMKKLQQSYHFNRYWGIFILYIDYTIDVHSIVWSIRLRWTIPRARYNETPSVVFLPRWQVFLRSSSCSPVWRPKSFLGLVVQYTIRSIMEMNYSPDLNS